MPNITIEKIGSSVIVDFGNYSSLDSVDGRKASYKIDDISVVWLEKDDSFVNVKMKDAITTKHWMLSYNDVGVFVVDTIDGVAPSDNVDLFNKITAYR